MLVVKKDALVQAKGLINTKELNGWYRIVIKRIKKIEGLEYYLDLSLLSLNL